MNSITLNNTRYHQQNEMISWCEQHIGKGGWTWGIPEIWEGLDDWIWAICSLYGYTTFSFKNSQDFVLFTLRWS